MAAEGPTPTPTAESDVTAPIGPTAESAVSQHSSSPAPSHVTSSECRYGQQNTDTASTPLTKRSHVDDSARQNGDLPRPELQAMVDQFTELEAGARNAADSRSAGRVSFADPLTPLPPRKSSLQPSLVAAYPEMQTKRSSLAPVSGSPQSLGDQAPGKGPDPLGQRYSFADNARESSGASSPINSHSPLAPFSLQESLPPSEPDSDLPFDFHRFLEQLRHRTADPVAKFLRSFLAEFGKKQWMVHEQVKIIGDFLSFITGKMAQCEVWRDASDAEFENAREGMEKLVMNRLYSQTFSPVLPPPRSTATSRLDIPPGKQPSGGRRGQHQEDVERDEVLAQKIQIYQWTREEHLDIPSVGEHGKRFLNLAQQELSKLRSYRAPRDKVICILNCCKVLFGLLKSSKQSDTSADSFLPLLIYVVLQANPDHLVSNVQYIVRFRNQDKLGGEAGYYVSSLMGAIQFIENMDRTVLNISDDDFEKNVEAAVSAIAERESAPVVSSNPSTPNSDMWDVAPKASATITNTQSTPKSVAYDAPEANSPASGILDTIQRPLSNISHFFSDETGRPSSAIPELAAGQPGPSSTALPLHGAASISQNADARAQAPVPASAQRFDRLGRVRPVKLEHDVLVDTLASMFPDLEKDVIVDVVRVKNGRVSSAVDSLLALNT